MTFGCEGDEVFNGRQLWLQVSVKPILGRTYTPLYPRQPITVVPYALHALSADKLLPQQHQQDYLVTVEISGIVGPDGGRHNFYHVSGMDSETEVIEFQDGEDPVLRKRPGRNSVEDIVLKRFVTNDLSIYDWFGNVRNGQYDRRSMVLCIYNKQGNMVLKKNHVGCWPYKFEYEPKGETIEETISFVCEEVFDMPLDTEVFEWSPQEPVVRLPLEVEISGVPEINFTEVSGLGIEVQVITFQDGDDLILRKRPGRTEGMNFMLKYLGQGNTQIGEWYQDIRNGSYARRSILLRMNDSHGGEYLRMNMIGCWPMELGAEFNTEANDVEQHIMMVSEEMFMMSLQ